MLKIYAKITKKWTKKYCTVILRLLKPLRHTVCDVSVSCHACVSGYNSHDYVKFKLYLFLIKKANLPHVMTFLSLQILLIKMIVYNYTLFHL